MHVKGEDQVADIFTRCLQDSLRKRSTFHEGQKRMKFKAKVEAEPTLKGGTREAPSFHREPLL